jgi:predicted kinase
MLTVISGLPGVGKTTVADLVGGRLSAVRLSIDTVEEALLAAGLPHSWETGVAAYEAAGALAELNLRIGRDVVVDAVNDSEPARDTWRRSAASAGAALCWVVLTMSDSAAHASRLRDRQRGFVHLPEPTWADVAERAVGQWVDAHHAIDVTGSSAEAVAVEVERHIAEFRRSD